MRQLGEWVRLIHELRELRRPEECLDDRAHRPRVYEIVERNFFGVCVNGHSLFDQARHARQTDRELIRDQLADRPNAPVAQMVDVVHMSTTLMELNEIPEDSNKVFLR